MVFCSISCNFAVGKIKKHNMEKHDFVTIADLTREKILYMIEMAHEFEQHPNRELLKGKVVATLFFEPSTNTNTTQFRNRCQPTGSTRHRICRPENHQRHQGRDAEGHHIDGG